MAMLRFVITALVLASCELWLCRASHPSASDRDQYQTAESGIQTSQVLREATDQQDGLHGTPDSAALNKLASNSHGQGDKDKKLKSRNLQLSSEYKNVLKINHRKPERKRRSYWVSPFPSNSFQNLNLWQPQVYPIQRPYFIPIYGPAGSVPIYLPPQPLLLNPGEPKDNPILPFKGPSYLPPSTSGPMYLPPTSTPPSSDKTKMKLGNRFGGNDYDEEEGPVWDMEPPKASPTRRPSNRLTTTRRPPSSNDVVPTRRPVRPATAKTSPPLVHGNAVAEDSNSVISNVAGFSAPNAGGGNHLLVDNRPETQAPPFETPAVGPSRCVWAIVSCCSANSNEIRYNCFEQLGCQGPFWGTNPCDSEFAKAAIQSALNYYNVNSK